MENKIATQVDPNAIPGSANAPVKERKLDKVTVKNVRANGTLKDIDVELVAFDPFNDDHVEFAYNHSDMIYRAPSPFATISDAARGYVRMFMVHTSEDEKNPNSDFNMVLNDVRACRTLFHTENVQKALADFFENA